MSTQYIHVTEFLQTIFAFSILILIGQRLVMTLKGQDQKYLQQQLQELYQQIQWEKTHQITTASKMQQQPHMTQQSQRQDYPQIQQQNQLSHQNQYQSQIQYQHQPQIQPHSQPPQYPQQPTLKTSLNDYQNDQSARKISTQQYPEQKRTYKRKSLTDLAKQNNRDDSKQVQIKEISDQASSRKASIDTKYAGDTNRGITNELNNSKIINEKNRQPSFPEHAFDVNKQFQKQVQSQLKLQIFALIDRVFSNHLSVLMSMLVLGILVQSTYITSMICLFGYVITHLLLKLRQSINRANNQPSQPSKLSHILHLLPKLWIFALFINYWADTQYSL